MMLDFSFLIRAGAARVLGAATAGSVLLGIAVDTAGQSGGSQIRLIFCLTMVLIVFLGWRYRSSLATGFGLVGLTTIWALSQAEESATGAVVVGALATGVAVILSWLAEPRVHIPADGQLRRATRMIVVIAGSGAVGLIALQFVDRAPAGRVVVLFGVLAIAGTLVLLYALGDSDADGGVSVPTDR